MLKFKIYTIILILSFSSCIETNKKDRVIIENYSIGDKVKKEDFYYQKQLDSCVLIGVSLKNKNFTVFTWYDTIVQIMYFVEKRDSCLKITNSIKKRLQEPIVIERKNELEYNWNDQLTGDAVSIIFSYDSIGMYKGALVFLTNEKFTKEILPAEKEIKIVEFEE